MVGGFIGAWASVFLASIACAIELALSGASPLGVVLPAMAGVHALIGIGEGLITGVALSLVLATRTDLLQLQKI
jgi:cobalt/nickel transport system permease protein